MKRLIALFLCMIFLCGCSQINNKTDKLNIVATNFVCYDFARAVLGDKAEITMLIPPGSDMHAFEPSAKDIANIHDCDLFLYIGGTTDNWAEKTLSGISDNKSIRLIDTVTLIKNGETYDEHVWGSPENAIKMINAILEKTCEIDANNSDLYRKNAKDYIEKIDSAEQKTKSVIDSAKVKKIVVADRFPLIYFTEYYGLEYEAAFGGCEHDTDASLHTVAHLIDSVKEDKLTAVYRIGGSGLSVADAVSKGTGAKILKLNSYQNISADQFKNGITYIDIMNKNAETLREGLN